MKCPRDGSELKRVTIGGVELDKCHRCDGIWLDHGELEQLSKATLTELEETLEQAYGNPLVNPGTVEGYMQCPKCEGKRLQQFSYTYMNPVRVDRCEGCYGIWVDKGELDAIAAEKKKIDKVEPGSHLRSLLRSIGAPFRKR